MAILNSVKAVLPGFGTPTEYQSAPATVNALNATTTTVLTGFNNTVRSGMWHIRCTALGAGGAQITAIKITGTDGTNTEVYYENSGGFAAGELPCLVGHILTDLLLTSISIAITMANVATGTSTTDLEFAGNN